MDISATKSFSGYRYAIINNNSLIREGYGMMGDKCIMVGLYRNGLIDDCIWRKVVYVFKVSREE